MRTFHYSRIYSDFLPQQALLHGKKPPFLTARRNNKPFLKEWLAEGLSAIGCCLVLVALGLYILLGDEPLQDAVQSAAHRAFVADLCPHLPRGEEQTCRDWVAKGGRP